MEDIQAREALDVKAGNRHVKLAMQVYNREGRERKELFKTVGLEESADAHEDDKPLFTLKARVSVRLLQSGNAMDLSSSIDTGTLFVGAWMGNYNPGMSYKAVKGHPTDATTGLSQIKVAVLKGDTDWLKVGLFALDETTNMPRHIASGALPLTRVLDHLQGGGGDGGGDVRPEYWKSTDGDNAIQVSFEADDGGGEGEGVTEVGTSYSKMRRLIGELGRSPLWQSEKMNAHVINMTNRLKMLLQSNYAVSKRELGDMFTDSSCSMQMDGCKLNYPLMCAAYDGHKHAVPLSMLAYFATAVLTYYDVSVDELMELGTAEFAGEFIRPLVSAHTLCKTIAKYSSDLTFDKDMKLKEGVEDFGLFLCMHHFTGMRDRYDPSKDSPEVARGGLEKLSMDELLKYFEDWAANPKYEAPSKIQESIVDDCETLVLAGRCIDSGVQQAWKVAMLTAIKLRGEEKANKKRQGEGGMEALLGEEEEMDELMQEEVCRVLGQMLQSACAGLWNMNWYDSGHFEGLGRLLGRMAVLSQNARDRIVPWVNFGMTAQAAQQPSAEGAGGGGGMTGHSAAVLQVVCAAGMEGTYKPVEFTSNVLMKDLPASVPRRVRVRMESGEMEEQDIMEVMEMLNKQVGCQLRVCCDKQPSFHAQWRETYTEEEIQERKTIFYRNVYFAGFRLGETIPAIVPLDSTVEAARRVAAELGMGEDVDERELKAMFGRSSFGLDGDGTKGFPIDTSHLFGGDKDQGRLFMQWIQDRFDDVAIPQATRQRLLNLQSRWAKMPLPRKGLRPASERKKVWHVWSGESFWNADTVAAVAELKRRFAEVFNLQQEANAAEGMEHDGVRMDIVPMFGSVHIRLTLTLPQEGQTEWMFHTPSVMDAMCEDLGGGGIFGSKADSLDHTDEDERGRLHYQGRLLKVYHMAPLHKALSPGRIQSSWKSAARMGAHLIEKHATRKLAHHPHTTTPSPADARLLSTCPVDWEPEIPDEEESDEPDADSPGASRELHRQMSSAALGSKESEGEEDDSEWP